MMAGYRTSALPTGRRSLWQRIIHPFRCLLIPLCMATVGAGCATTQLLLHSDSLPSDGPMATITFTRLSSMVGASSPLYLSDAGTGVPYDTDSRMDVMTAQEKERLRMWQNDDVFDRYGFYLPFDALLIGEVGPGGRLTWKRPPGLMELVVRASFTTQPNPCYKVEGGKTYVIEYNFVMGRVENAYCLDGRSPLPKPLAPSPVPAKPCAVQTIDRLQPGAARGYAEFYVPKDSDLEMLPVGQILATNLMGHSTVYPAKKLRIACPPGSASFFTFILDNFKPMTKGHPLEFSWTMDRRNLKLLSFPNEPSPVSVIIQEGMVTPVCVRADIMSSDKRMITYRLKMTPEASRPEEGDR